MYANLEDLEFCNDGQHCVYGADFRRAMDEFTPSIINKMFQLPDLPYDKELSVTWTDDPIEDGVFLLSIGHIRNWDYLTSPYMSRTMAVMYKS